MAVVSLGDVISWAMVEEMKKWNNQPKGNIDKMIEAFNNGDERTVDMINKVCYYYTDSVWYQEGNTEVAAYKICCETVDYCSFYKQTWFFLVCAGVGLLIIIILIVVSCCCFCKGRGRGGKDLEVAEESSDSTYSIQDDSTQKD